MEFFLTDHRTYFTINMIKKFHLSHVQTSFLISKISSTAELDNPVISFMDELTKSVKNRHNRYNIFIANATNQNESQRKSENLVILKNYMDCTYFSKKPNNVAERYDQTIFISYIYFLDVCFIHDLNVVYCCCTRRYHFTHNLKHVNDSVRIIMLKKRH